MALRCDWLVLCERVIEDVQTGGLTLVNCLDLVQAWSLPSTLPGFGFAARFTREGDDDQDLGVVEFRFVRSSEAGSQVIVTTEAQVDEETRTLRVFFNFAVLRLFREETAHFRIDWRRPGQRWRHGPSVSLPIRLYPQEIRDQMGRELSKLKHEITTEAAR